MLGLAEGVVPRGSDVPSQRLHERLAECNQHRFTPTFPDAQNFDQDRFSGVRRAERDFVESERRAVKHLAERAPEQPEQFVAWFADLQHTGPGQNDPLFAWLADHATHAQMRWFLRQEVSGEAGFEDLLALTQVKMPHVAKLEIARNYWDEMGQGHAKGMHGPMLGYLAEHLQLDAAGDAQDAGVVWEALALANLMCAFAHHRHYAYQSVGALGVIELTAPGRAQRVNQGLKRLQFDVSARRYYALHATLDVKHSIDWNARSCRIYSSTMRALGAASQRAR